MTSERPPPEPAPNPEALLAAARAGGPEAAALALRAAQLAEGSKRALAREALTLALRFEPLDPIPRLALARLSAEDGAFADARREAEAVLSSAVDQAARARAAFLLGEIARLQGDFIQSRLRFSETLRIEDALLAASRGDPSAVRWYARARGRLAELDAIDGERERALAGAEGALAMLRASAASVGEPPALAADIADAEMRLAEMELANAQPASARRRLGEAIGRYEALAVTEREEPHWRDVLADAWALAAEAEFARGQHEAACDAMDKALHARLRLAARDRSEAWALAGVWRRRAMLRAAIGDQVAAADSFAQARALAEQLVKASPLQRRFLVHTLLEQADHALREGELEHAREAADLARQHAEQEAVEQPAPEAMEAAAACWDRLGETARKTPAPERARDAFARAVEFRRLSLTETQPASRLDGLAAALIKLGDAALTVGANAEARASFEESATLRFGFYEADASDVRRARALAVALERFGLAALAQADRGAARAAFEDALILADAIFSDADDAEARRFRGALESNLLRAGGVLTPR
ncbi:MAG: hypothetical protein JNM59_10760 [Hyphomonadaceae bacterium]|nr:hypothetical protein [Hyphomonadaceae bacterium]